MRTSLLFKTMIILIISCTLNVTGIESSIKNQSFSKQSTFDTYNYIIITTDGLQDSVTSLKNWRENQGYSVKLVTDSWIYYSYKGIDNPEKIRNFLINKYNEWEIKYLLIIGSIDNIPMRYCYPDPSYHPSYHLYDWVVPTDFFYADLTGDWDADRDGFYGEGINYTSGKWDDRVDLNPEIYVGRIPVDDKQEIASICQKIIRYEQDSGLWKMKALLLGAILDFEADNPYPWELDEAQAMEQLRTNVFIPKGYNVTTMYEREGLQPSYFNCDYPLNEENVLDYWQDGYGFVCWGSHGGATGSYRMVWVSDDGDGIPETEEIKFCIFINSSEVVRYLHDSMPSIVFSCSCNNAYPEEPDNLGATLIKNGAVIFIGATRIAYSGGSSDINSEVAGSPALCRYFIRDLIQNKQTCGEALYNSKIYCYNKGIWMSLTNIYGFNLYGDPAMRITMQKPPQSPPMIGIPSPNNVSFQNPLNLIWSIPINDLDGDSFSWAIQCSNGQTISGTDESNGIKSISLSGLLYNKEYKVWVNATDSTGSGLYTQECFLFMTQVGTNPPDTPTITGPASGKAGEYIQYKFETIDFYGYQVYYFIDWGDNTTVRYYGPFPSGEQATISHIWTAKGFYTIKAKAWSTAGGPESDWATLPIIMPYSYQQKYPLIELLFKWFPNAFPLLRYLVGY